MSLGGTANNNPQLTGGSTGKGSTGLDSTGKPLDPNSRELHSTPIPPAYSPTPANTLMLGSFRNSRRPEHSTSFSLIGSVGRKPGTSKRVLIGGV